MSVFLINVFVSVLVGFSRLLSRFSLGRRFCDRVFEEYCFRAGRALGAFITYHRRPVLTSDVYGDSLFLQNSSYGEYAIVIQGPLSLENDFTIETVNLYLKNFPGVKVIVSTWVGSDQRAIDVLKSLGCMVVLNVRPVLSGSHNVNYQIVSTFAGIELAEVLGCKYVLKTRCDQRFYSAGGLGGLVAYLSMYPVEAGAPYKGRIIEPGISVCRYRLWSMCDMFQFGYIEDVKFMWALPLDSRSRTHEEFDAVAHKVRDLVEENIAEIYIHRSYAERLGFPADVVPEHYYQFMAKCMLVIDKETVDLFWNKYSALEFGWVANPLYKEHQVLARVSHADWLMLLAGASPDYAKCRAMLDSYEQSS